MDAFSPKLQWIFKCSVQLQVEAEKLHIFDKPLPSSIRDIDNQVFIKFLTLHFVLDQRLRKTLTLYLYNFVFTWGDIEVYAAYQHLQVTKFMMKII